MPLRVRLRRALALPAIAALTALLTFIGAGTASADPVPIGLPIGEVAFQANTNHLFVYNSANNAHADVGFGMAAGTSPALSTLPSGAGELTAPVAFQANSGVLWLYYPATNGHTDTGLHMAPGTSPSVAPGSDDFAVAFQGSNGHLIIDR